MNKATNPADFPIYENLKKEEFKNVLDDFINLLKKTTFCDWKFIGKDDKLIIEIINLIQKRRVYFHVFHEKQMGELNEISLVCFWILKLRPFFYKKNPRININLTLSITLFKQFIERMAKIKGKKIDFPTNHLLHAFKYRDLSKEAIMAIAESLIC
ncbi:MAG: hypothetical protein FWG98_06815 [Candidatus Cloacimonetes bacterium]|nr:hypothetical protein [Candidatus Cloacimonadota bacterium]